MATRLFVVGMKAVIDIDCAVDVMISLTMSWLCSLKSEILFFILFSIVWGSVSLQCMTLHVVARAMV